MQAAAVKPCRLQEPSEHGIVKTVSSEACLAVRSSPTLGHDAEQAAFNVRVGYS